MNRGSSYAISILGISTLVVLGVALGAAAAPPTVNVEVVNDPTAPLPVAVQTSTGPVMVTVDEGQAPLPVTVEEGQAPLPVTIDAAPEIPVTLYEALEKDEDESFGSVSFTVSDGSGSPYVVPEGKTLVIETASFRVISSNVQSDDACGRRTSVVMRLPWAEGSGGTYNPGMVLSLYDTAHDRCGITIPLVIRVPSGEVLRFAFFTHNAVTFATFDVILFGKLIDGP